MKEEVATTEVVYCARHPKEETALTCASCGVPICPRCMVPAPVGMKCPDCGRSSNTVLYQVGAGRFLLAFLTALAAGLIAAFIGRIAFFFVIFLAIPYGYFAGNIILKASGMKRGRKIEILAGAGMILGALGPRLIPAILVGNLTAGLISLANPFFLIAVVLATGAAVSKIRYL